MGPLLCTIVLKYHHLLSWQPPQDDEWKEEEEATHDLEGLKVQSLRLE